MSLWIILATMALLTVALLARPILRSRVSAATNSEPPDLALYRAQLKELENELGLGLIAPTEAVAARTEIERRMLRVADGQIEAAEGGSSNVRRNSASGRALAMSLVILMATGAVALYVTLGTPRLPSMPLDERLTASGGQESDDYAALVERLAARMEENPSDARGWLLLGQSYGRLERFADSAGAYRRAIELGSREAETLAAYGEALVGAAQGLVLLQARSAFERALADDRGNPRARYYLGLAAAQAGDLRAAYDVWRKLAADAPSDAPWRAILEGRLRQVAAKLEINLSEAAGDEETMPPSGEAIEAAVEMSDVERAAAIRTMVDRLAARLASDPTNFDGWMQLGRAYRVLGDRHAALQAYERAVELTRTRSFDPAKQETAQRALDDLRSSRRSP